MTFEEIREYCLQKKEVTESMPFDGESPVFKVCDKMFLLMALEKNMILVKCDPEKAIELREEFAAVQPGYHMNKTQWNSVYLDGTIPPRLIMEWVDDSYRLVVQKLPKKLQAGLL